MDKLDETEDTAYEIETKFSTVKDKRPVHGHNEEVMPNGIIDSQLWYCILIYI